MNSKNTNSKMYDDIRNFNKGASRKSSESSVDVSSLELQHEFSAGLRVNRKDSLGSDYLCDELSYPFGDWRDMCRDNVVPTGFEAYFDDATDLHGRDQDTHSKFVQREEDTDRKSIKITQSSSTLRIYLDSEHTEDPVQVQSSAIKSSESRSDLKAVDVLTPNKGSLSEIVDNIFVLERKVGKTNNIAVRRDVIHKCIIRYFHKFYKTLFSSCLSPSKNNRKQDSYLLMRKKIEQKHSEIMHTSHHVDSDSLIDLITWIASKHLKAYREVPSEYKESHPNSELSANKKSIVGEQASELLDDLLKGYSHIKLQRFFENQAIRVLFKHFLPEARKHFCEDATSSEKKMKYEEALRDFQFNLTLFQNNS